MTRFVEALADRLDAFVRDELVGLVRIPSPSGEEHAVIEHLESRCRDLTLPCERLPVPGGADDLVIGHRRPALLITAHVDTIRPDWTPSDRVEVRDGRVEGLGAQDDKGCVVAAIAGLLLAREAGVDLEATPVAVGLCVDEEVGGTGSTTMAKALRPPHVVGLEGTELGLGIAEAGFVEGWCHLRGNPIHGALRELGANAIDAAVELIERIRSHPAVAIEHPLLGRNLPMIWEIRGGQRLNVVPDSCSFHLDWRVNPGGPSAASLAAWLESSARELGGEVEFVEVIEPFATDPDEPVVRAMSRAAERAIGATPSTMGMVAWTDAHSFVDHAGSRAVVFGPGHLRFAHQPGESVAIADVAACARTLAHLIEEAPTWIEAR